MAIKMQTCYTDQTATVNKLLNEDWEPFAVFPIKVKKNDQLVTRQKIYFRKHELEYSELVTSEENSAVDLVEEMKKLSIEFNSSLVAFHKEMQQEHKRFALDILNSMTKVLSELENTIKDLNTAKMHFPFTFSETAQLHTASEMNLEVEDENDPPEESRIDSDTVNSRGDMPDGEAFRVVEDVPTEVASASSRTQAQEDVINTLRERYGNISVFSAADNQVKVLAANFIYYIKPSGETIEEQTNANTSSLMV